MARVLLFGEALALFVADGPGSLADMTHFTRSLAGAEVNVSIGLSRLGANVTYVTSLGRDPFGQYALKFLTRENIDTSFIRFDDENPTGFMMKNQVGSGDPEVVNFRRHTAASHISPSDIEKINLTGVKHVHITGIPPALSSSCRTATYLLFERARAAGCFISFDPNLRPALWESKMLMIAVINDLASRCDLLLPGCSEGKILTGSNDPVAIADYYQNRGVPMIFVKVGAKGCYARSGKFSSWVPGFDVPEVVDTVGAGDGFAVGAISGLLDGLPYDEAAARGCAIGALQVTVRGDNEGLPSMERLKEFMESAPRVHL